MCYLIDIKKIVDTRTVIGSLVTLEDHIEVILDGIFIWI